MTNEQTFNKLISNMKDICTLKKEKNDEHLTLVYLFVITKDNYDQILQVPEFAKDIGFDMVHFQLLHVEEFSEQYKLSEEESKQIVKDIAIAEKDCMEKGLEFHSYINIQLDDFNESEGTYSENTFDKYGCLVGWQFTYLDHKGLISLCCGEKEIDILYKDSFKNQWESETYSYYRRKARHFDKTTKSLTGPLLNDFCLSCDNVNFQNEMVDAINKLLVKTDDNYYEIFSQK